MRWWLMVAFLALAGCSDAPAAEADADEQDFDEFELDDAQDELGVIRGVVVDAAIKPLAGALVAVTGTPHNVTTRDSGAFAFKDLAPGAYFLKVSRPGYADTQTNVEVVAGVKDPDVVKVLLERKPGTEPSLVPLQFDGHITCSARIPTGFATGCLLSIAVGDFGGDRMDFEVANGNVHWMQTELTWDGTLAASEGLCLRVYGYGTSDACGKDPVIQAIDEKGADANGLGQGDGIEVVTYADYLVAPAIGLVVEQEFQAFTHVFYNFVPPVGWEFGRDGEPPVPV